MSRSLRTVVSIPVGLLVAGLVLVSAQAATALFTGSDSATVTVTSAMMPGPGSLGVEQVNCRRNGSVEIELQWTATSASYATSYVVERSTSSSGSYARVAILPIGSLVFIDTSTALNTTTTYYYRVSALYMSWSAPSPLTPVTTLNKQCH
ncbi:MAG: hypothetical protein ACRDK4_11870 [Solirubrobacteraceae bacterium]